MFSLPTKALFAIAGIALFTGAGYAAAVGDRAGTTLLFTSALGAASLGLVLAATTGRELPGARPADAAPAAASAPSAWPLVTAVGLGVLAVGAAVGSGFVALGAFTAVLALVGWFAQSWAAHPSWTAEQSERVGYRLLVPLWLPLGVLALVGVIVVSFSRVLLAAPSANASTAIALVAAVAILGVCSWVASRPMMGSSAIMGLVALGGAMVMAAGVTGAVAGEREFHHAEHEEKAGGSTIEISAENVAFSTDHIEVHAGAPFTLKFRNLEPLPHNVAIYDGDEAVFTGNTFSGPDEEVYEVEALEEGTYSYRCDVHPNMKGQVVAD